MKLVFLTLAACLFTLISKTAQTEQSHLKLVRKNNAIQIRPR